MATILIVDDDSALREGLAETVTDLGHHPLPAASGAEALARLREAPVAAVLLDLRMPGDLDGMATLARICALPGRPPVTVLTAFASPANTIEAMRLGAHDHLTKPVGRSDLAAVLDSMLSIAQPDPADAAVAGGHAGLIGSSAGMRRVQKTIGLVADTDSTVLIQGETGTGKEEVARALHAYSARRGRPFVPVNCAAIPAELLESELFGHVRGAFTGAVGDRAGAFHQAEGGTLFLDEIGDMPPPMQAKILRVIQDRMVTPLGGRSARVDVRLVAATHRDLPVLVDQGRFRADLYYRLNVVPILLPPLRERLADIVPLAEHFLAPSGKRLSAGAASRLLAYGWPGNVRELRNVVERAAVLVRCGVIAADAIDLPTGRPAPSPEGVGLPADWLAGDLPGAVARLERTMIAVALREADGNRARAARRLGIQRQLLYAKIERYGLGAPGADLSEDATVDVGNSDASDEPRRG
ncbi:sigma-54-dependent transcriptional regulator [Methylobacterium pseudosasicola]|uniref:DNA-binding transcriptional response regulator, NtrC family, contains REC, AAA-type ATPase, and a Fis-type DNA-binding domains n=1 Tax=Methylobacterium pseudosasicola TaxID=582667 RepID=A0A1I4MAX4_9HYPH|nr:sigma-54 dependent transcriptional regulator [Methylobacterium pseudosasicola]SFM00368.1 DNA-binding transcriptional response regulator, NtrC family, contains REC, AAA-type ATPase, and a Fis-type DNA-binding domains [Methylobacterium pseudosasicola]